LSLTKYYSANKIKKNEIGWTYSIYGGRGEVQYGFWQGNPEGKRPLGKHRHSYEDNIKMYLKEVGWVGGGAWTGLIWFKYRDRWQALVHAVMNLQIP